MYVLDVIPLSRSAPSGSLSYRSKAKLPLGSIVSMSLRRQTVPGVVIQVRTVAEAKSELKSASFLLSKSVQPTGARLPAAVFEAAERIAAYHAAPLGSVLGALLTDTLTTTFPTLSSGSGFKMHRVERSYAKRMALYRTRIRAAVEAKTAALLILPTIAELERAKAHFADLEPLILLSTLTGTKRAAALAQATTYKGLILATPSFAWTPISKLGMIAIERYSAGSYVALKRPYIDMRIALEELARARAIPFTIGDFPLPLEVRSDTNTPLAEDILTPRVLIDTRRDADRQREWETIPLELQQEISATLSSGGTCALLAIRKGYSPTVVCRDCGTAVTDSRGRVLTFTKIKGKNVFRSSDGKEMLSTDMSCALCGSWNLLPLGIGVERVYEEALRIFPNASVVHFDANTPAQARKLLKQIYEPGTIVVGTEFMLPWLPPERPFDVACVVSADTLLSLPFWRARERFVRVCLMLAERSQRLLLASRNPEDTAVQAVLSPGDTTFFAEESTLRKALGYPPFGSLIHLSAEATPARLDQAEAYITKVSDSVTFLPRQASFKGLQRLSAVIRIPSWPQEGLSMALQSLPPWIRVRIDTETLW